MKPNKPKDSVSLKKVAKTYKKNTTPTKVEYDGARTFDMNGQDFAVAKVTKGKNTYKPKPKSVTLGSTNKGKGVTKFKKGKI